GAELCSADYWVRQAREPVRFGEVLAVLAGLGVTRFAEAGPGGALTALAAAQDPGPADGAAAGPVVAVPVLRGDRGEEAALAAGLARLHVAGVAVDWALWVH